MSVTDRLVSQIKTLDFSTLLELQRAISNHVEAVGIRGQLEQRGAGLKKSHCPHCGCDGHLQKWGSSRAGTARLRCMDCRRTFSATTGTPFFRLRFRSEWLRYLDTMSVHISLVKLREKFGFHHHCDTLLRWRHRFLRFVAPNPPSRLTGVIQVDETYFRKCYKGHKAWARGGLIDGRLARKRGGASKRGLSREQAPVLTAIDSNNDIFQEKLPDRKRVTITNVLRPWIQEQSVICSDGEGAYRSIASDANCAYVRVKLKTRSLAPQLNLARINAYHGSLKDLIYRDCRGVNTQYLPFYLGWARRWTQSRAFGKPIVREMLELTLPNQPRGVSQSLAA